MKLEDFEFSLAVSAVAILFLMLSGVGGGMPPLFALFLLALCQAGFFALEALKKAGLSMPNAAYLYIFSVFAAYAIAALCTSLYALIPMSFIPLIFCAPPVSALVRNFFAAG